MKKYKFKSLEDAANVFVKKGAGKLTEREYDALDHIVDNSPREFLGELIKALHKSISQRETMRPLN